MYNRSKFDNSIVASDVSIEVQNRTYKRCWDMRLLSPWSNHTSMTLAVWCNRMRIEWPSVQLVIAHVHTSLMDKVRFSSIGIILVLTKRYWLPHFIHKRSILIPLGCYSFAKLSIKAVQLPPRPRRICNKKTSPSYLELPASHCDVALFDVNEQLNSNTVVFQPCLHCADDGGKMSCKIALLSGVLMYTASLLVGMPMHSILSK